MPIRVLTLLLLPMLSSAHALDVQRVSPEEAWSRVYQMVEALPPEQRKKRLHKLATMYLELWESSGREPRGDELHLRALFLAAAGRTDEAQAARRACARDAASSADYRSASVAEFTRVVLRATWARTLDKQQLADAVRDLESLLETIAEPAYRDERMMVLQALAQIHDVQHDAVRARARWRAAAALDPGLSVDAADSAKRFLLDDVMNGADAALARHKISAEVTALVSLVDAWERAGEDRSKEAKRLRTALRARAAPFELLGRSAPAWVVEHAYGKGSTPGDYRGRVVLVDCWATWCVWCIRSFPVLRGLHEKFAPQGLSIVGVTAPANRVWESRFSCDPGLAGEDSAPLILREGASKEEITRHRAQERLAIGKFVRNHKLAWDVVLAARGEPRAKLGLAGWPHLVLIDRQGRIRALHGGALGYDQRSDAALRRMIQRLLAEK
jgi:thiol-disulfide isomerase/thioredoxin